MKSKKVKITEVPVDNLNKVSNLVKVEKAENLVKVEKAEKPKFKIVHANELADYQRTEVAKTKEVQTNKFIVINWQSNNTPQSESSLMSYIRKKGE